MYQNRQLYILFSDWLKIINENESCRDVMCKLLNREEPVFCWCIRTVIFDCKLALISMISKAED